jgi:hypothetical protein
MLERRRILVVEKSCSKLEKWYVDESKMEGDAFQIQMASCTKKFQMEKGAHLPKRRSHEKFRRMGPL